MRIVLGVSRILMESNTNSKRSLSPSSPTSESPTKAARMTSEGTYSDLDKIVALNRITSRALRNLIGGNYTEESDESLDLASLMSSVVEHSPPDLHLDQSYAGFDRCLDLIEENLVVRDTIRRCVLARAFQPIRELGASFSLLLIPNLLLIDPGEYQRYCSRLPF